MRLGSRFSSSGRCDIFLIKAYVYYVLIALYIQIFLYGGYFKDANSEKDLGSEKGVVHADLWVLDPRSWEWNKVKLYFMNGLWFLINHLLFYYLFSST